MLVSQSDGGERGCVKEEMSYGKELVFAKEGAAGARLVEAVRMI